MIYEEMMKPTLEDFGRNGKVEEHAVLRMLENISCYHSDSIGLGAADIEQTHLAWILLEWKVKILKNMTYGNNYRLTTWSRGIASFCTTLRDFEIYDESGELCVIASSKWTPVDAVSKKLIRITDELLNVYGTEEKAVFEGDPLIRLKEPKEYECETPYRIRRSEIDLNGHVHNLCYLDFALEALPEEVYHNRDFRDIRITYRKEIKAEEKDVVFKCHGEDGVFTIGIYGADGMLRALVELK
jgi:acyl-ACP thioesterase